jgi:hypothetical protein
LYERGFPLYRWPEGWRAAKEAHRQEVHTTVWQLKCEGKVREDREGKLWAVRE